MIVARHLQLLWVGRKRVILHLRQPMRSLLIALRYVLWVASPALQSVLAVRMLRLRLVGDLRLFFAYTVLRVLRFATLFAVYHWPSQNAYRHYFLAYWTAEAVESIASVLVIYEISDNLFKRYDALRSAAAVLFRWAGLMLLLMSAVTLVSASGTEMSRLIASIIALERAAAAFRIGLLLLLFLFARLFALSWRQYVFGVAVGFAIYTSIELAAVAVRAQVGPIGNATWDFVNSAAYNCGVLTWIGYFFARGSESRTVLSVGSEQLESWNHELLKVLGR